MSAYESPIHELSYAVLLVSKLQVFSEIWQDDYRSVGTVPRDSSPLVPNVQRGSKVLPEINAPQVMGIGPELTYFSISQYKR